VRTCLQIPEYEDCNACEFRNV